MEVSCCCGGNTSQKWAPRSYLYIWGSTLYEVTSYGSLLLGDTIASIPAFCQLILILSPLLALSSRLLVSFSYQHTLIYFCIMVFDTNFLGSKLKSLGWS